MFVEFVEGPLWYFSAAVFVLGVIWRLAGIIRLRRRTKDLSIPRASAAVGALKSQFLHFVPHGGFTFRTVYHLVAGYAFHLGLFVLVLWAAPHITFIEANIIAVPWEPLPRWGFIIAAQFGFAGLMLLWVRRISDPVMIKLSDRDDHVSAWLTFGVMLTGCMALQESVEALRVLHMLFVEIWLLYFPFSRLMHAFTFAFSRGYTGALFGRRGVVP